MSNKEFHTPIFDSWPLSNGEMRRESPMPIQLSGPFPRWAVLSFFLLFGATLLIAPRVIAPDWSRLTAIADGFGIAFLTSSFLAFTIEAWLRADLAKDVFLTAIGHHLPESYRAALKDELMRLANFPFLCEKHVLHFTIDLVDAECVRVTAAVERTFINITSSSRPLSGSASIDEWFFPGEKSKIHECQIELLGTDIVEKFQPHQIQRHDNNSISTTTRQIIVGPGKKAKITSKITEIKRHFDELSYVFHNPTLEPTIDVTRVPDGFKFGTSFGPAEGEENVERYSNRRTLKGGMYWPLQRMRIHWWSTGHATPQSIV